MQTKLKFQIKKIKAVLRVSLIILYCNCLKAQTIFISNKEAYVCLYVSIKDTVNLDKNCIFLGLVVGSDFEQYLKGKFNPLFFSVDNSTKIEKIISKKVLIELPSTPFDAYLNLGEKVGKLPNGIQESSIFISDSVFFSEFSYVNLIHSNYFNQIGCYLKVLKVNVDYLKISLNNGESKYTYLFADKKLKYKINYFYKFKRFQNNDLGIITKLTILKK